MASQIDDNIDTTLPADQTGANAGKVSKLTFTETLRKLKEGLTVAKDEITALEESGGASSFAELGGLPTDNLALSDALNAKQATLVSGTNIKTINGTSVLGSGDITVSSGSALPTLTEFSTTIQLDGNKYSAPYTITGATAFTLGSTVAGGQYFVRLIANGTNVPTFSGSFFEITGSSGFDNTANVVNVLNVFYDGTNALYGWTQRVGDIGLTPPPLTAPVNTVAPVLSAVSVGGTLSSTNGTWTGNPAPTFTQQFRLDGVNIASNYTIVSGDVGKVVTCVVTATNSQGSASATSNSQTITAGSASQLVRFNTNVGFTETVNGAGYNYTNNAVSSAHYLTNPSVKIPASTVGSFAVKVSKTGVAAPILMLGNTNTTFSYAQASALFFFFVNGTTGAYTIGSAGVASAPNVARNFVQGDIVRISRLATSTIAEVSSDNGVTFTTIHTFATHSQVELFPVIDILTSGTATLELPVTTGGVLV